MNETSIIKTTSVMNTNLFLAISVIEYFKSEDSSASFRQKKIARLSSTLLFIAGLHYAFLEVNTPSIDMEIYVRYSDWILTTPLLLMVLGEFYSIQKQLVNTWIFLDLVMVFGGLLYEKTNKVLYWYIGTFSYLLLLSFLSINLPDYKLFVPFFLFGWTGYGIVSRFNKTHRVLYYNILDFYNKFVFAIVVDKLLKDS